METKDPFEILLERFRVVVREEIAAANSNGKKEEDKEWLRATELARLYNLPKTWFEERGREGTIERSQAGRYVLFKRRSVEQYLESKKTGGGQN